MVPDVCTGRSGRHIEVRMLWEAYRPLALFDLRLLRGRKTVSTIFAKAPILPTRPFENVVANEVSVED